MAKNNIFSRAKAYVKDHPRTSFQDAIQKVKGQKVSGTKPKPKSKVSGTKSKPRARIAAKPQLVARTVRMKSGSIGAIKQSQAIIKNIDKLEKERSAIKNRELRDIYALTINAEHQKLKDIAGKIRKRA